MNDKVQNDQADGGENPIDELSVLKARADQMGIKYSPKIGVDALRAKVNDALNPPKEEEVEETKELSEREKEQKIRADMRDSELALVRLRITNLNPQKKDLHGEIFTVANKYVGIVKKYVPYGEATENGYHVPNIIYKQLKARKFLNIRTRPDRTTGNIAVEQTWAPEFALEVLPPLTDKELAELAKMQAAKAGA